MKIRGEKLRTDILCVHILGLRSFIWVCQMESVFSAFDGNHMLLPRFVTFSRTLSLLEFLFSVIEGPRLHYFSVPPCLKLCVSGPLLPGHRQWRLLRDAGINAIMHMRQCVRDLIPSGSSGLPSPPFPTFLCLLLLSSSGAPVWIPGSVHNTPPTLISAWPSIYFSVSFFLLFFFFLLNFSSPFNSGNI